MPVTHKEVERNLGANNAKNILGVPQSVLQAGPPYHIYNVSPYKWEVGLGSLGTYVIAACESGQKHSRSTPVPYVVAEGVCLEMFKAETRLTDGGEVVKEILGTAPMKPKSANLIRWGVFVAAGEKPTAEELTAARAQLLERYTELVQEGDHWYEQGPNARENITAQMRQAAKVLNVARPWNEMITQMVDCPGCGEPMKPGLAVHARCGAVLDRKKYAEMYSAATPAAK